MPATDLPDGIAVIGMACRFPGAPNVAAFWDVLREGRETIRHFTEDELRAAGVPSERLADPQYVRAKGVLDGIDRFDASFFGISAREASLMDPQHRIWLECVWEAFEDAGYHAAAIQGYVGVFAGCRTSTYLLHNIGADRRRLAQLVAADGPEAFQMLVGNDKDFLPTRTSHRLDLKGPSICVQTACSTSLVAVVQACQSLLTYQSDVCVAGGACITSPSVQGYVYQESNIYSPDGHCRAFDARAAGTVFSDGVGAVVLKRLEDAVADGDAVDAVIRGWGVNNDGAGKVSFAAPSVEGQAEVIALAQAVAGINPRTIHYVEAHGTGTPLGDPVEVAALTEAFRQGTDAVGFCGLGSVKTNIGHTDAAAGAAGLLKTVLALRHGLLPPSLHFEKPNPALDLDRSPFYVVSKPTPWPDDGHPRRAGVSALGIGGTNAHVVLEEAPARPQVTRGPDRTHHLLALSARSEGALRSLAGRYATHLDACSHEELADVCFTANTGRAAFMHRLAAVADTGEAMQGALAAFSEGRRPQNVVAGCTAPRPPRIAFLFTGQGAAYSGMGHHLYRTQPVFRSIVDRCAECLRPYFDVPLYQVLFDEGHADRLEDTAYAQPALFVLQAALLGLWRSWGVEPEVVLGHSAGEFAAAYSAGVFGLEDGLRLAAERGRLMQGLPRGAMAAVLADEATVRRALQSHEGVVIASVNAPEHAVISGEPAGIEAVLADLRAGGVTVKPLPVSHAFHSPMMEGVTESFGRVAAEIDYTHPKIPFISTVMGEQAGEEAASAVYWRDHIRRPVRFAEAIRHLDGVDAIVEIGPQPVLLGLGRRCLPGFAGPWLLSLQQGRADDECLLKTLGTLWAQGCAVDRGALDAPFARRRLHLPTYPFERQRYWVDPVHAEPAPDGEALRNGLLGRRLALPLSREVRFEGRLSPETVPHLADHQLFGTVIVAAASIVSLILSAAEEVFGEAPISIENLSFLRPFVIPDATVRISQLVLRASADEGYDLHLVSRAEEADPSDDRSWTLHVTGSLRRLDAPEPAVPVDLATLQAQCPSATTGETFYEAFWGPGGNTGPAFRWIESIRRGEGSALGHTQPPDTLEDSSVYPLPPGLIEAGFQTLFFGGDFETRATAESGVVYVPFHIERIIRYGRSTGLPSWCYARAREKYDPHAASKSGLIRWLDDSGRLVAAVDGFEVRKLRRATLRQDDERPSMFYRLTWVPQPLAASPTHTENGFAGSWIILTEEGDLGKRLAAAMVQRGVRCHLHVPGTGDGSSSVPHAVSDVQGVVYVMATEADERDEGGPGEVLSLMHTLAASATPPRLWLATRRAQPVRSDLRNPEQAALWGMGRVAARELPALRCTCVDLELDVDSQAIEALVDELLASGSEGEIAFRGGARHLARLTAFTPNTASDLELDPSGRYLITEGCSSQGLAVARWLAERGARHLILAVREPAEATGKDEIRKLEQGGVHVAVVTTDLATVQEARRVLETAGMPVRGIVYLSAVMDDGVLAQQTPGRFREAMRGTVDAAVALHQATLDRPLDFFVCFSTSAAVLGTPGQSSYAAAGAVLDALMHQRRAQGQAGLSINWGPWAEVGKAATLEPVLRRRLIEQGWAPLATEAGLQAFGTLLQGGEAQAAVLPLDWSAYRSSYPEGIPPVLRRSLPRSENDDRITSTAPPVVPAPATDDAALLTTYVREQVAGVLGVSLAQLAQGDSLLDLGFDSLAALLLANRFRSDLGISVSMAVIIEERSLTGLTRVLTEQLGENSSHHSTPDS